MTASEADAAARNAAARLTHDPAVRRQVKRSGRERGCWTYIPADVLRDAGIPADAGTLWYRTWGRHSRGSHSVVVGLYREP